MRGLLLTTALAAIGCKAPEAMELLVDASMSEEAPIAEAADGGGPDAPADVRPVLVEPPVTVDEVLTMMRRVPAPCALTNACSDQKLGGFEMANDAEMIATSIALAVNTVEPCQRVLCTKHDDAALLTVFAAYDSANRRCGTWRGVAGCAPTVSAVAWLGRARDSMEDCSTDYGHHGDGSTSIEEGLARVVAGSCRNRWGQNVSEQRVNMAMTIGDGQAVRISEHGYVYDLRY